MPPIIMNDCGSGGVSSGSLVIIRGGWVLAEKQATIASAVFLMVVYISSALIFENMNNVSSYNVHQKENILIKRYLNEIKG